MLKQWKTIIALGLIYIATVFNWYWVWGVAFIAWAIPSIYSETAELAEPLTRRDNPYFYWLCVGSPILIGIQLILLEIIERFIGWATFMTWWSYIF